MGDKTRGDGRKFVNEAIRASDFWFEPIFLCKDTNFWHGLTDNGINDFFYGDKDGWREWTPPKQIKKVKLYRPIYKTETNVYVVDGWWRSYKAENSDRGKAVGWQEMEVEVTE